MTAFLFVPLLAFTVAYSAILIVYSSHVFLVVVEDTAAGNDEVVWPSDPLYDWLWKGVYLAWLGGVWLVPALLFAKMLAPTFGDEGKGVWYVAIAVATFWLAFPISLLSSMSAESSFSVLHGGLFARLARRPASVVLFYLFSGIVAVGAAGALYALLLSGWTAAPFLAAIGLGVLWLLYARLTGRLALLARLTPIGARKKKVKRRKGVAVEDPWAVPDEAHERDEARAAVRLQPSELPPIQTPFEGEVTGYDVRFDDDPPPEPPRRPVIADEDEDEDEDEDAMEMVEDGEEARPEPRNRPRFDPDRLEMERARRREEHGKEPDSPWVAGVWGFPFYPRSLIVAVVLALGFGLWGACFRLLVLLWPV